jgi:hypothetical protein
VGQPTNCNWVAKPALAAYMFDQVSQVAIGDRRRNPRQVNSGGKTILHLGKFGAKPGSSRIGQRVRQVTIVTSRKLPNYDNTRTEPVYASRLKVASKVQHLRPDLRTLKI